MEDALKQYQERLSQAQAFTNTGLWEYDIQTGQLYWSKECEALFGLEEGEFTGSFEAFLERVHPDDRDYVFRINQPIVKQRAGQSLEYEHRIIRKGGEVRWVRETAGVSKDAEGSRKRSPASSSTSPGKKRPRMPSKRKKSSGKSSTTLKASSG